MPKPNSISRIYSDITEEVKVSPWLRNFLDKQQTTAVEQARSRANIINQVNNIMRNPSRYATVDDAVQDMRERTGLNQYLSNIKSARNENGLLTRSAAKNIVAQIQEIGIPGILNKYSQQDLDILVNYIQNNIDNSRGLAASVPQVQHDILHTFGGKYQVDDIMNGDVAKFISRLISEAKSKNDPVNTDVNIGRGIGKDIVDNDQDYWAGFLPAK